MDAVKADTDVENVGAQKRPIGTEKLAVRTFREVFLGAAQKAGLLQETLDRFLRAVLDNESADSSDRKYAKVLYEDAIIRIGGSGLPDWARTNPPIPLSQKPGFVGRTRDQMKDGEGFVLNSAEGPVPAPPIAEPSGTVSTRPNPTMEQPSTMSDDDFDELLSDLSAESGPDQFSAFTDGGRDEASDVQALLASEGALEQLITREFKTQHPFIRCLTHKGVRYAAVGSMFGVIPTGPRAGHRINVNFTINPFRKLRDVTPDILVHEGGRMASIIRDDVQYPDLRRGLYLIRHRPGLKLRFWSRVDDQDVESGRRFIILTDDAVGYRQVERKDF